MNKIIILFVLSQFWISDLSSQTLEKKKEITEVMHTLLGHFDFVCLNKNTYYGHTTVTPIYVINNYLRVYSYNVMNQQDSTKNKNVAYKIFYKEIDGVITKEELEEIKKSNLKWKRKAWERKDISNPKVTLIKASEDRENCQGRYMKIAEPVFTTDGKKAMVFINSSKSKNSGSSSYVQVLEKKDDKWQIKGSIPLGTGG